MIAPWQRLFQEKLYLAKQLLEGVAASESGPYVEVESRVQGALALMNQARSIYLVLLARLYQQKKVEQVADLDALETLLGFECHEAQQLREAETRQDHWWGALQQLERQTMRPRPERKEPQGDGIIAVSAAPVDDRSPESLMGLIEAMKDDVSAVCERHSEW